MRDLFYSTLNNYTNDIDYVNDFYSYIINQYNSSSRFYHNIDHLTFMFKELAQSSILPLNRDALILSIFYHDAIYKSTKKDNEYQSALILEKHLAKTDFKHVELCKNQINATKNHATSLIDPDTNLLIDIDLAILGHKKNVYQLYTENVRKEYSIHPKFIYNPARKKAMQHFLEQDRIFKTDEFYNTYESMARDNISKEINNL
ncbi:putative metal-dependent HD superfamily phosphohydrolase [Nonlabens xylanidelens]|uniref:Putative metal-dependent HD superfamily phosphohydrolase n=1 Tax=Nonlabens xylanidelens TaxID=191564 RepID=A0A2S6IDT3_9FLAO|nr:hypothetical protein [Nonlabens xylanidelens]PPK92382.1 putative metal-dependent HD superfamily phosphohydrolase [Nonlabens xylanidelens]